MLLLTILLITIIGIEGNKFNRHECVTVGNLCKHDHHCCSHECVQIFGESHPKCIRTVQNFWREAEVMSLISDQHPQQACVRPGHFCFGDDDCCFGSCLNTTGHDKLHHCDTEAPNYVLPKVEHVIMPLEPIAEEKKENSHMECLLNGERCFDNSDCCSKKCFFLAGDHRNLCVSKTY